MSLRDKICEILWQDGVRPSKKCYLELNQLVDSEKMKLVAGIITYLERRRMGKDISHKAMTLNNEEIWMFKKEDILRLTEI